MTFLTILGIIFLALFLFMPGMRIHTLEIGSYIGALVVILFKYFLLLLVSLFVYLPSKILNLMDKK